LETHRRERLDVGVGRDTFDFAIALELPQDGVPGVERKDGPEHLGLLVADGLDPGPDRQPPGRRIELGPLEVAADVELIVGRAEAVEGGERELQVLRVPLACDQAGGVRRFGAKGPVAPLLARRRENPLGGVGKRQGQGPPEQVTAVEPRAAAPSSVCAIHRRHPFY
jgi:hypothetical protein